MHLDLQNFLKNLNIYYVIFKLTNKKITKLFSDLTKEEIEFSLQAKFSNVIYIGELNHDYVYDGKGVIFSSYKNRTYIKFYGNFSLGLLNGIITELDSYGYVKSISTYDKGNRHGISQFFLPSNKINNLTCIAYMKKCNVEYASYYDFDVDNKEYLVYFGGLNKKLEYHGQGKLFDSQKRCLYNGQFKNGRKHGKGIEFSYNNNFNIDNMQDNLAISLFTGNTPNFAYNGYFSNNNWHGEGYVTNSPKITNSENNFNFSYNIWQINTKMGILQNGKKWNYVKIYNNIQRQRLIEQYEIPLYDGDFKKIKASISFDIEKDIIFHGKGVLYNDDDRSFYTGHFKNNKKHGVGSIEQEIFDELTQDYKDIVIYQGSFKNDEFNGYGQFLDVVQNQTYIGYFKNHCKNGQGLLLDYKGEIIYEGYFHNNHIFKKDEAELKIVNKIKIALEKGNFEIEEFSTRALKSYMKYLNIPFKNKSKKITLKNRVIRFEKIKRAILSKDEKKLNAMNNSHLKEYLLNKSISKHHLDGSRTKLLTKKENVKLLLHYEINNLDEDNYDLFGNKIINPCLGNDGQIYDLHSMQNLFKKNEKGDYINISSFYNNENILEQNFPVMHNGKRLSSYEII